MAKNLNPDKKQLLLDAALDVFSENGYWATKISDIVAKANVAQGTFYLYFKNKEELFKEMLLDINNESKKEMREILERGVPKSSTEAMVEFFINKFYKRKKIVKVFLCETLSSSSSFIDVLYQFKDVAIDFIEKAIKIDYPDIEVERLKRKSFIIYGLLKNVLEFYILKNDEPYETVLDEVKSLIKEVLP
jgi:AcrR family transcriptional regulator